jgi:hypothetical protein
MSAVVLDAGALIGLERNDRQLWAALKLAARSGDEVQGDKRVVRSGGQGGHRELEIQVDVQGAP